MRDRVFITGATGFIGSHMARRLIKDGYEVHALMRSNSDMERIRDVESNIVKHIGDLTDREGISRILRKISPNHVIHFAVSTAMSGVTAPADEVVRTNLEGMVNLVDALKDINIDSFINTGTFLEYGSAAKPSKEGESQGIPPEIYSITKLASTQYGQVVARKEKKPIITIRFFTPYGPHITKGRLVYNCVASALKNEPIRMTGPKITRDFIYVEDLMDLYLEAMKRAKEFAGEIFNAGTGKATTFEDLIKTVIEITGSKSKVEWGALPSVVYDNNLWQADMEKTFSHFSWRPKTSLEEGLKKTCEWFRNNQI